MPFARMATNWKTTGAALMLLLCAVVLPMFGIVVPGFTMDPVAALTVVTGLLFAKDQNVTGGQITTPT